MTKTQMAQICNLRGHKVIIFNRTDKCGNKRIYVMSINDERFTTSSSDQAKARHTLERLTDKILLEDTDEQKTMKEVSRKARNEDSGL